MMQRVCYFLLALLAEALSWLAFALGFIAGACRAAYARGWERGFGSEKDEQPIYTEDD